MQIKMLKTRTVAVDNFTVEIFKKNETYDVRQSVGCKLVADGMAEALGETTPVQAALERIRNRFKENV